MSLMILAYCGKAPIRPGELHVALGIASACTILL